MTAQVAEAMLRTRDGVRLAGDLYRPAGPPRGAVVLVHGFAGSGNGLTISNNGRVADAWGVIGSNSNAIFINPHLRY